MELMMPESDLVFDYIVVGAGSAGCVLAANLSKSGTEKVLLLEAGPAVENFWIKTPIGYGHSITNKRVNWMYHSQPEEFLAGRRISIPRGRLVGGSSAINAMVYVRGTENDFSDWAKDGNPEWTWEHVLASYKRIENHSVRDSELHGLNGPLEVNSRAAVAHPLCEAFLEAGKQLQFAGNEDFNGRTHEGVGHYHHTIAKDLRRMSAARAWLRPARKRKNLKLEAEALVLGLVLDGRKVTGVRYRRGGKTLQAVARREVILSAGSINTPQLLMVSGIGPGKMLQQAGIEVVHVMPAVGQHMQDHTAYDMHYRSNLPTLNQQLSSWFGKIRAALDYFVAGTGPLSSGTTHAGGFVRSSPGREQANMQLYFSPLTRDVNPGEPGRMAQLDTYPAFSMSVCNTRPFSRGSVGVRSDSVLDVPEIRLNLLSDRRDVDELVEGARLLRRFAATPALKPIIAEEYLPGPAIETNQQIEEDLRQRAYSIYHPCGTCRMASDIKDGVVSSRLRVHGLEGLRIADASVFPYVTTGNLNAPSTMVGQRASEIILEDAGT